MAFTNTEKVENIIKEHGDTIPFPQKSILKNQINKKSIIIARRSYHDGNKSEVFLHDSGDNNRNYCNDASPTESSANSANAAETENNRNGSFREKPEHFKRTIKTSMRGLIFVFLWYSSIFWSVFFIYCPLIPLLFINRSWFRKLTDIILSCWEMYPAVLLELMIGCRVYISGDNLRPEDGAILLMNHRNRLDWFFLWAALLHGTKPPAHRTKFVLKSDVRNIPGIGWGLQLAGFLYIHRNWEKDQSLLARSLNYFKDLGNKYQILIFAEGTDLSPESKAKSNAFALKNGMKTYDYVLHPRTTGFTFLAHKMQQNEQLDAVYDMTIAYPKTLPETEMDILQGKFPQEVHFHIKRYERTTLPKTEVGLKSWCEDRWGEKEEMLKGFYGMKERKEFCSKAICETPWNAMYLSFVFWTLFTFTAKYFFFTSSLAFYWVISCTVFFVIVSRYTDGIQQFEISLHNHFANKKRRDHRNDHDVQNNAKTNNENNGKYYSVNTNNHNNHNNHQNNTEDKDKTH